MSSSSSSLPTPSGFSVLVSAATFKFNLAHFVAYKGFRERLHGHNYKLSIELFGPRISSDGYVLDFGVVKSVCKAVCKSLNEHVIIPQKSDVLDVRDLEGKEDHVIVTCEDGCVFVFPKKDCYFAEIAHSTVEEISLMLYGRIMEGLGVGKLLGRGIDRVVIGLSEALGQESTVEIPVVEGFDREEWERTGFNGFLKRGGGKVEFKGISCGRCGCQCGEGKGKGGGEGGETGGS
ncbi:hypothetical protein TrST_g1616 [Triparma strigata]|uniref:6-pyruvoyltetrahydropterin synthase n=1 Tax=Triparma strigata TaxID=1606541 RepID=A0A9W6ZZV0_9STRA|nr:hypothetical protein TrST_g1616 [Triparma strigata]